MYLGPSRSFQFHVFEKKNNIPDWGRQLEARAFGGLISRDLATLQETKGKKEASMAVVAFPMLLVIFTENVSRFFYEREREMYEVTGRGEEKKVSVEKKSKISQLHLRI